MFNIDPTKFSPTCIHIIQTAYSDAQENRMEFFTPEHLLLEFISDLPGAIPDDQNWKVDAAIEELKEYLGEVDRIPKGRKYKIENSVQLESLLKKAVNIASEKERRFVGMAEIFAAMYANEESFAAAVLNEYFGNSEYFLDWVEENTTGTDFEIICHVEKGMKDFSPESLIKGLMGHMDQLMGSLPSPEGLIDAQKQKQKEAQQGAAKREQWEEMLTDVSDIMFKQHTIVGRDEELERTIRVLCRKDKNNPLYIGEAGVGKTAMIYKLAMHILAHDVPDALIGSHIYMMDMGTLVAGASYSGEFERRLKMIMEGAKRKGNVIIYIDEIHNIMGAGANGNSNMDASNLMKPYLEDGSIRFIGSTTYQEYSRYMAKNKGIARRFHQIDIKEPSIEETINILEMVSYAYERHHHCKYNPDAIRYIVEKSAALIPERFLPDKAIDILDEAGSYREQHPLMNKQGKKKIERNQIVDIKLVKDILTDVCRIDAAALKDDDNSSLKTLHEKINGEIFGQEEAVKQVVRAVQMAKAGLTDTEKPLASLLFVGPTGVGKTEVCRVLAKELGVELVRFDMSEYMEAYNVSKLIGSSAGYVGYDDGGLLTEEIRKHPNCVLLMDEIEKAHPNIYNILLQVMDYAKLSDNKGNKVDFKNVILVMTSNAGAQYAGQAAIGFGGGVSRGDAMLNTVKKTFKPEFINRLSGTVVFNDMNEEMAKLILDKKLKKLEEKLAAKNVTLNLSAAAHDFLLKKGFTKEFGAREMDRAIQNHLTPLLMDEILFGNLAKGGKASVDLENDKLIIK